MIWCFAWNPANSAICSMKKPDSAPKKKMQNVDFDTVEELLDWLPEDQRKITEFLRKLVYECVPDVSEKLSFNVPYFFRNAGLCFIWPGAVSWETSTHEGVRFGFQHGNLLTDEIDYLDKGKRKQVYWRDFFRLQDIDVELLRSYIYEAVVVDESRGKGKLRGKGQGARGKEKQDSGQGSEREKKN
jgi:hypothetical protein